MHFTEIISVAALGFCALIGMGALISPKWAAGVVRLQADPDPAKPGGYSEFRATYGGLLLFLHLMAIVLVIVLGQSSMKFAQMAAVLPIAAGWFGAGFGRLASLVFDKAENRAPGMIPIWIPLEILLGLAIAAPILHLTGN